MSPRVSIILTTHGAAPYLKQAIGSVLAQTFEDWECWIAVDGLINGISLSMERTLDDRFQVYARTVPDSITCRFAHTINEAFGYTKGDFITYLCHDDLYLPWRLELMLQHLACGPDFKNVVYGQQKLIECFGTNGAISNYRDIRYGNIGQPAGTVDHSSVMHRRECFEKAGGWDEAAPARYGDAYFWNRLLAAGYKFHCIPEVLDCHRFNQESLTWKLDNPVVGASYKDYLEEEHYKALG